MKDSIRPIRKLLDRVQRRFIRSRPGSVLILVVALLVLMALIGISFMTMAQFDRAAAVQHTFNTEVDLLVDGVISQVKATVTNDLFLNGTFRSGATTPTYNLLGEYAYYNGVGPGLGTATQNGLSSTPPYTPTPGDNWLGSRVPDQLGNVYLPAPPSPLTTTTPVWPFITAPINGGGLFDTPYWPSGTPVRYSRPNNVNAATPPLSPFAVMIPGQTTLYPSFQYVNGFGNVLAADADGDGIADSGLVKLLTLDGVTYYAAVRIVDNCAAINANIACMPNPLTALTPASPPPPAPQTTPTGIPGDFSPVNLDLLDMLAAPATELPALLSYRFHGQSGGQAVDDTGAARTDFTWMGYPTAAGTFYPDQQWAQLGRRLQNPGNVIPGSPNVSTNLFQALPITESMTMAKNFVLRDPNVASAATSSSILEQALPTTAFALAHSTPYPPNNVGPGAATWFGDNFNYPVSETNGGMPMRALLVARNPVSNFCPFKFTDRGLFPVASGGPVNFGDMVTYNGHRFVCINPAAANTPPLMITASADPHFQDRNWAFEPWTTASTKTSVNTASFQQLYAAYWAVMCTTPNVPPFPNIAGGQRMFRSPLRSELAATPAATPPLTTLQVLYLRAAIAAVNTMDLRDSDDDVTSRTIQIPGTTPTMYATIYGIEKQPYITQAYGQNNTDPSKDWAAIELHNPYPTPLTLTHWHVAAAKRTPAGGSVAPPVDIGEIPTTTIPPNGYVVLIDSAPQPMNVTFTATTRTVAGLGQKGFGNEVLIMRPRLAVSGNPILNNTTANNLFDEGTTASPKFANWAPVDAYDFTYMPVSAPPMGAAEEWQYQRPSNGAKSWHCVYPGPWNATTTSVNGHAPPTLSATKITFPPAMATPLPFGMPQTAFLQGSYVDVPIQLNNADFGGPNKATNATTNKNVFPYGTFARNGDILQVPFIGSYMLFTGSATSPTTIVELNPVTMDSIVATAQDQTDGTKIGLPIATAAVVAENIGRFTPIDKTDSGGVADDFAPPNTPALPSIPTTNPLWRYHWATRLFDFFTVQSPQDDYSPNVDPGLADLGYPAPAYRYPASATALPTPTPNVTSQITNAWNTFTGAPAFNTGNATEETAPVDGLVNINSAPWRVLATVPWLPATNAAYSAQNANIAKAIAFYRDVDDGTGAGTPANPKHGHGPFKSLFELNEVLVGGAKLRDIQGNVTSNDFSQAQGNLSPIQGALDGVVGDFESLYNMMTRVSNLVTTRSDSYTAYILIQGWRNAETANPTLLVQRRAAIIIDRSAVTPSNPTPSTVNIPLD